MRLPMNKRTGKYATIVIIINNCLLPLLGVLFLKMSHREVYIDNVDVDKRVIAVMIPDSLSGAITLMYRVFKNIGSDNWIFRNLVGGFSASCTGL